MLLGRAAPREGCSERGVWDAPGKGCWRDARDAMFGMFGMFGASGYRRDTGERDFGGQDAGGILRGRGAGLVLRDRAAQRVLGGWGARGFRV